jgi:hypothetical protein
VLGLVALTRKIGWPWTWTWKLEGLLLVWSRLFLSMIAMHWLIGRLGGGFAWKGR